MRYMGYPGETIETLSDEDARDLFDRQARKFMGMSGAEFLAREQHGEFQGRCDLAYKRMTILLPLVRDCDANSPTRGLAQGKHQAGNSRPVSTVS